MSTKYKQVKVNLDPEQHEELKRIASQKGMSLAQLFRSFIGAEIEDSRARNVDENRLEIIYQIAKIGNNLNQIARHCNTEKSVDRQVLEALIEIEKSVKRLL